MSCKIASKTLLAAKQNVKLLANAFCLALLTFLLVPGTACSATAIKKPCTKERYQYSAKFICGKPDFPVVAPGKYFTAINVHNPTYEKIKFQKKIAIAYPGEKPGEVSEFFFAFLGPDQALEIDCPDIMKHAPVKKEFLKGFVVIESEVELDVVAVYSAGSWKIEALSTERVPYRIVGEPKPVKPIPAQEQEAKHCPKGKLGDQVGKEGCCCNKPRVRPPKSPADWWPDCAPGLTCVGNLAGTNIPTSTYATCVRNPNSGINPPIHWSQPPYCGQK